MRPNPIIHVAICWLLSLPASAQVTFDFDYSASPEFNHPTLGAARRAAMQDAGSRLASALNHTATIQIEVVSNNAAGLASAGSEYVINGFFAGGYVRGVVHEKIITGTDLNGAAADGTININFAQPWDFDDDIPITSFDFKSTMMHEMMHALGFLSGIRNNGEDDWGSGVGNPGIWEAFDNFISDANGVELINDTTFVLDRTRWLALRGGGLNGVFFNGPNARAANDGNPVGLYSPTVFEPFTSFSHLDDENPDYAGLLTVSTTEAGLSARSLSGIERGILMDIGYSLNPPPVTGPVSFTGMSFDANGSRLDLTGPADTTIRIETSRDIDAPAWGLVQTLNLTGGTDTASISLSLNPTTRFFRGIVLGAN